VLLPSLVTDVARDLDEPDEDEDDPEDEDGRRESVGNDGGLTRDSPPPEEVELPPEDPPDDPPDDPDEDEPPLVRGIAV